MKSLILVLAVLFTGAMAQANETAEDMIAILNSTDVKAVVGETTINSIINQGKKVYQISFASCVVDATVRATCNPIPGGACSLEVNLNQNSLRCRYER